MRLTKKLRPFLLTTLCLLAAPISPANAAEALRIAVLSSRADMVTSGNALVEIAGADRDSLTVSLDGRDLAKLFRPDRESRKLIGRIRGLKLGKTVLEVEAGGGPPGSNS